MSPSATGPTEQPGPEGAGPPGPHFVGTMGLEQWSEGQATFGRATISPEMCVPGTRQPRIGVLATMVDVVSGMRPDGPINPTVDLRVNMMTFPSVSTVRLSCDVLRSGRTLFVAETRLF